MSKTNAKPKPTEDGLIFDSREEMLFYRWCKEAQELDYISSFQYHPKPFSLSNKISRMYRIVQKNKVKEREYFLLHPHIYTPDFLIRITQLFIDKYGITMLHASVPNSLECIIDVKGGFSLYNNHREFALNQKWVYDKYRIYVNKVEPSKFFKLTWKPAKVIIKQKGI